MTSSSTAVASFGYHEVTDNPAAAGFQRPGALPYKHRRDAFARDAQLGLLGFVGSSEIDSAGGRGLGTMLNFQGIGLGTSAEQHGRRMTDLQPAAVLDGCALIFRRLTLKHPLRSFVVCRMLVGVQVTYFENCSFRTCAKPMPTHLLL